MVASFRGDQVNEGGLDYGTSLLASERLKEDKFFCEDVLYQFGTIGLVILDRSRKFNFDRKKLYGQSSASMSKFSAGMSLNEMEREIGKALSACFRNTN